MFLKIINQLSSVCQGCILILSKIESYKKKPIKIQ